MDMGQCNDAYTAIQVAVALADAFGCGVNDLPLTLVLSWYEQKAVCILLTLLSRSASRTSISGPTLPAFVSPNVECAGREVQLTPISTPEEDLKKILGKIRCIRRPGFPGLLFLAAGQKDLRFDFRYQQQSDLNFLPCLPVLGGTRILFGCDPCYNSTKYVSDTKTYFRTCLPTAR